LKQVAGWIFCNRSVKSSAVNCIQKKLWITWSKFRFLRLPVEKRVRLEVTTDGRHLTFILVSLYESGYGVRVFGGDWFFRELMLLRKVAPIPFLYGGADVECGISITDQPSTLASRPSTLFVLDYDYFTGLLEKVEPPIALINTDREPHPGGWAAARETAARLPEGRDERERTSQHSRIDKKGEAQGCARGTRAGASAPDSLASELARDAENTSPTRSASVPAGALLADHEEIGSARGNQPADSKEFLEGQSQAGLQMDNQKGPTIRTANDHTAPGEYSSSVLIRDIRGKKSSSFDTGDPPLATALHAPYFMHPSVYHRGLHKKRSSDTDLDTRHSPPVTRYSAEGASASHPLPATSYSPQPHRRFRIGFFGTHDREFYTKHYHFPGMNRFEILEVFLQKYGSRMTHLRGFPRDWDPCEIAVSIDARGGDRSGKAFLSQEHYFEALHKCDFVLSPSGWCMPVSHNLIEAMFCGAIPITNGGAFMAEPLADDVNCLAFKNVEELAAAVERALAMDVGEVERMRWAVLDYYERVLEPNAFGEKLLRSESARVLVNAEENSVPLVFAGMVFPWDVPAEAPRRGEEVSGANL
jgi:hypothetical protein